MMPLFKLWRDLRRLAAPLIRWPALVELFAVIDGHSCLISCSGGGVSSPRWVAATMITDQIAAAPVMF